MTATAEGTRPVAREEDVEHPLFAHRLPRVNLLPASVPESFTLRRIRRIFIALALLLVVAVAAFWYLQKGQIDEAEARLSIAQAESTAVTAKLEALAPIKQMHEQITSEQELVATTLASEPQAALVIERLVATGAAGGGAPAEFTSIVIEYGGIPENGTLLNPCPNPDPFSSEITIGCVTFSGTAADRDQVSAMLNAMAADPLFIGPYVSNSTISEASSGNPGGVTFTGSAGVSLDALKTPLSDDRIAEILAPPSPAADAAATEGGQ